MHNVLNRSDPCNGFFRENAKFQRERTSEFALEINRAATHAGDHAGMLHFGALELDKNDGLLWAEKIVQHADDFKIELFDLVAGEDRVRIPRHAGAHLA